MPSSTSKRRRSFWSWFGKSEPSRRIEKRLSHRRLVQEPLESRMLLSVSPTRIALDSAVVADPRDFVQIGSVCYFTAQDASHGRELWVTDGTQDGTHLVKDIKPGVNPSNPKELVEFNGMLYFVADDGVNGEELWRSDGTTAGTVMVKDINPGQGDQYPYGFGILSSFPRDLTIVDGVLYFSAEDNTHGAELWRSDGTAAGTVMVKDIFTGTFTDSYGTYPNSSNPANLVNVGGTLFFTAYDDDHGWELWTSDGTEAGTRMVKDIFTGTFTDTDGTYPNSSKPSALTDVDGVLYFVADDGVHGVELWKSDGSEAGTTIVKDIRAGTGDAFGERLALVAMNGILFFAADDGIAGDELWRSDGTAEGTYRLKDVKPGSEGNLSYFTGFTVVDDHLFFSADDGTHGRELWKTDGTEEGTALVADIALGTSSSYPFYMTAVDGILYFSAYAADTGRELWQSDGTRRGTVLVADGAPGTIGLYPRGMESVDGFLVFAGYAPDVGRELYSIDFSAAVEDVARLSIWIDGQKFSIDAEIGVYPDETTAMVHTINASGEILVAPYSGATLADFFEIWRTNAGGAGNNADATFDGQTLMGHVADTTYTVQMFVNGEICDDFENYIIRNRDEIVLVYSKNPVLALNTNYGPIVIELFGEHTPITVANFLTYVNDGDYIQSFIHRSVPGFVIQGGGFTTDTTYFTDTTQFQAIVTNPTIVNEPGISNTRGTLAMAKLGSDPNSATSQFFVNLANNSANLDFQNGGFTVFGQVLDMYTVDLIASLPIDTTNASPYSQLPYSDAGDLVVFESIEGLGRISGYKFHDANINDQFDAGDTPIAGAVIYVDANNNGQRDAGEIWTTTDANGKYLLQIAPGEYILRSEVTPGNTGIVDNIPVTVQIGIELADVDFGEVNLSVPSSVVLAAESDTGAADDDNLTRLNNAAPASTLQFVVAGVFDGAVVRVYANGVVIGLATASGDTVTVTTDGGTPLADGEHLITATQTIGGAESEHSEPLTVTVDTIPPATIQSTAPEYGQIVTPYTFDADSPDEGGEGILYSLRDAPEGMTIDPVTGQIAWTPSADQDGPHQFEIVVSDAAGNESTQTVSMTVLGEIAAYADAYAMEEDGVLTVTAEAGVLANDDPDEQFGPLTVSLITGPNHGTLVLNQDGSFTYTPDADSFGTDTFTYRATDGDKISNIAVVTITVTNVNDAPVAQEDSYTTAEDTPLVVTAANGVLANDTDADGDALTAILVAGPNHGTLTLNENGSFTYTPNANYHGTDSFTYRASDGTLESDPVTVTITITEVDDPPVAVNDSYTVNEDQVLTVTAANGVLANDTDPDTPHANLTAVLVTNPANGSVTLNADGSFTYTPNANFAGTDTFTYRASDGTSTSAAATVTITVVNVADPPVAVNDTFSVVNTGATHVLNVLANDYDPDPGDAITLVSVTQGSSGGAVAVSGGSVNYTPTTGFVGQETFTYTIRDNDGQQATATVTVTVTADTSTGNASIAGFVYVDANGDGLKNASEVGVPGVLVTLVGTTTGGSSVTRTVLTGNDGSFVFANLAAGTYSLSETQPVAMKDGLDSASDTAAVVGNDSISNIVLAAGQARSGYLFGEQAVLAKYVSIRLFLASTPPTEVWLREVVAQGEEDAGNNELAEQIRNGSQTIENTAPTAVADSYATTQGTTLTVNAASGVLANDTDADGDTLSAILVTGPTSGTLSLAANGSFTYVPTAGFTGTVTFTYRAQDGTFSSNIASVTITVQAAGAAPTAVNDAYSVDEDATLTVAASAGVLVNDSDPDGDTLSAVLVSGPSHGTISLAADGSFTYTPTANYHGTDTFTYRAADGSLTSNTATVTITVNPVNDAPVGVADQYTVATNATLTVAIGDGVLANDTDVEDDELQAHLVTGVSHGTLELNANGSFVYTPAADFQGNDTFVYRAFDGQVYSAETTVTIVVNSSAVVQNDAYSVERNNVLAVETANGVLANDSDPDGDALTAVLVTGPSNGVLILNADGSFTYTPNSGFHGTDTFTYAADDGLPNPSVGTVTITVTKINHAPVGADDQYTVAVNETLTVGVANGILANDTDPDGDTLIAHLFSYVSHGALSFNTNGSFVYTPNEDFQGIDTFAYKVYDGETYSGETTVTIIVNSPPVAAADAYEIDEDGLLTVDVAQGVLINDSDPDGDALTAVLVTQPANGTLVFEADGSFTYTPDPDFHGTDTFTYLAYDGLANSTEATVTITVNSVNDAPVGEDDSYVVAVNGTLAVDAANGLLANDTDVDDDVLEVELVIDVSNGTLVLNADGSFEYTPDDDFQGVDTFVYKAFDGTDYSDDITVTIIVNSPPVVADDAYTMDADTSLVVDDSAGVLVNDSDPDGDPLAAVLVTGPSNGNILLAADGSFTYIPNEGFHGVDSFTYAADDGFGLPSIATVTITVEAVDEALAEEEDWLF